MRDAANIHRAGGYSPFSPSRRTILADNASFVTVTEEEASQPIAAGVVGIRMCTCSTACTRELAERRSV